MGGRREITGEIRERVLQEQTLCMYEGPWAKPKGGRMEGGRRGWVGQGGVVVGKRRQLYPNNNKKMILKKFLNKDYSGFPCKTSLITVALIVQ